jgi:hypothetical protein
MSGKEVGVLVKLGSGNCDSDTGLTGAEGRHPTRITKINKNTAVIRADLAKISLVMK